MYKMKKVTFYTRKWVNCCLFRIKRVVVGCYLCYKQLHFVFIKTYAVEDNSASRQNVTGQVREDSVTEDAPPTAGCVSPIHAICGQRSAEGRLQRLPLCRRVRSVLGAVFPGVDPRQSFPASDRLRFLPARKPLRSQKIRDG